MRTQSPLSRSETRFLHTLYQSYAGPLYRVAHHRLGDPYLAQDLVQTVFLAAAEKLPTLRRHENPWAWLLRALHYEPTPSWPESGSACVPWTKPRSPPAPRPRPWAWPTSCPPSSRTGSGRSSSYTTKRACPTRRSQRILRSPSPPAAPGSPAPKSTAGNYSPASRIFPIERWFLQ